MATQYLGEIRLFANVTPPAGWLPCDGTMLPVGQYDPLFKLIGYAYGGFGSQFAVPDLRGRVPLACNNVYPLASKGGEAQHTLTPPELPVHRHTLGASSAAGTQAIPTGNLLAASQVAPFYQPAQGNLVAMDAGQILPTGGGGAHENMAPYLTLQFCIAIVGDPPN